MGKTLTKLNSAALAMVMPRLALLPDQVDVLRGCDNVTQALLALEARNLLSEAMRLVAHALPKREAVWWACMCALHTEPTGLPAADRAAREAAELWVRQPAEAARRTAMARAQATAFGSPEAWAAVGAFWSGDSIAPEGQPAVPPAVHLTGTAVSGSVALASVRGDISRRDARLRRFLDSARNIATGGPGRLGPEDA